jgi:choice-of-anchor A domain-containing protein
MKRATIPSLAILLALASSARADINSTLSTWNLVTYNNLNQMGEVEGRSFIGGNVNQTTSFQFAMGNYSMPASEIATAVHGNIAAGSAIHVHHGSIAVGGSSNSRTLDMISAGTATTGSPWPANNSPLGEISAASAYWSTLAGNSTISLDASGHVVFQCAPGASLAVFNVTDSATFERSGMQGFDLAPDAATSTILINVDSVNGSVDWATGQFFSLFQQDNWQSRVLFNFYNAITLNLHDQFTGYVLAPNADVTAVNNIDGGLVCNNLLGIGEVHLPYQNGDSSPWKGTIPVPEPATGTIAAIGMLLFAGARRMKR